MKKKHRGLKVSLMATSIATAGVVSYKILKKKYPEKLDDINNYVKDNISHLKETCIKEKNEISQIFSSKLEDTSKLINVKKCKYSKKSDSIDTDNNNNYVTSKLAADINTSKTKMEISKLNITNNNEENQININNNFENSNIKINEQNNINENNTNDILNEKHFKTDEVFNNFNTNDIYKKLLEIEDSKVNDIETLVNNVNNTDNIEALDNNNVVDNLEKLDNNLNTINSIETLVNNIDNTDNIDKKIHMPDNYIEDEIRYQLCLTNKEPITESTLKKLERIDFFEIDDFDIDIYCDFLSKYTNIKSIVIDALNPLNSDNTNVNGDIHCLKNISPLNSLKSLEELSFNWGINYIDFSNLNDLPNLKKLEIKFGMLSNIEFLSNFEKLEHLEVMLSSSIKDISNILNLKNLKNLYIYTNSKLDIEPLKTIPSLQYLYINGESIPLK